MATQGGLGKQDPNSQRTQGAQGVGVALSRRTPRTLCATGGIATPFRPFFMSWIDRNSSSISSLIATSLPLFRFHTLPQAYTGSHYTQRLPRQVHGWLCVARQKATKGLGWTGPGVRTSAAEHVDGRRAKR